MSAPVGPETVSTLTLDVGGGRLAADVLRFGDGAVRCRFGNGDGVGLVLTTENVAALRVMLANTLSAMFDAKRSAA